MNQVKFDSYKLTGPAIYQENVFVIEMSGLFVTSERLESLSDLPTPSSRDRGNESSHRQVPWPYLPGGGGKKLRVVSNAIFPSIG